MAAHQFPYGGYRLSTPEVPVYLVGDAAGLGDAMTGEGIYHALESGRLAGEVARDCLAGNVDHRTYYRRLKRAVLPDTFLTYQAAKLFYRDVDRAVSVLETPAVRGPMTEAFASGATFAEAIRQSGWLPRTAARLPRFLSAVTKLR
jgi:flavin-dependent dehydrogenase